MTTLKPEKDETLVRVITGMGLLCGEFVWPTRYLGILKNLNSRKEGYIFSFADTIQDISNHVRCPKCGKQGVNSCNC